MFWNNFIFYCNQNSVAPNRVAAKLGFSTGTVTWWKKGRVPRDSALQKIAAYFGVTVDDLLADTPQKTPPASKELTEDDMKLLELFHSIPEDKRAAYLELLAAARKLQ